jgi:hypothetical protein
LFDGEQLFFKPVGDRGRLLVDYWVGADAGSLSLRAMTRVIPRARNSCVVSLTAWREASMGDERWERLVACHEVEIRLIQALLSRI